ncbi:SET domain-containing protein [Delitschia confertaspora ATCC 74209]|uniref:SET domain-containing protein n=1 Tax=Delitschia confertaspora ATCC 74209 TaxID=1513339 RepID=A0A9P4JW58_9PLEO|nr:SET domain-containing protein [Delitschia confertaspora ATCC 74209]
MSAQESESFARDLGPNFSVTDPAGKLLNWFVANQGYINQHVKFVHDDSRGFHVRAAQSLQAPTVVTCPLSLTLSSLNLDPSPTAVRHVDSDLHKFRATLPERILSVLLLIEQASLGEKSFWYPYIACLPPSESLSTPLYFTNEDLRWLEGTNLLKATEERRKVWREEWKAACNMLREGGIDDSIYTWESFLWSNTIFSSRAFTSTNIFPDKPPFALLFPVLDILNHAPEARVEWDFDPLKSFTLKSLQDIEEGDEIFNNYAPKQNDEFSEPTTNSLTVLLGYGFALEHHPYLQTPFKIQIPAEIQSQISKPNIVPYGMPSETYPSYLADPAAPHFFRRGPTHPLGRYPNLIPAFRGIPPLLVLMSHLLVLHQRGIDPATVQLPNPGGRILVATVRQLTLPVLSSLSKLSATYPAGEPQNQNQKYSKIYRDGQMTVLSSILDELNGVTDSILSLNGDIPPTTPCIISTTEALALLEKEYPQLHSEFIIGVSEALGMPADDPTTVRINDCEDMVWILWFIVCALTTKSSTSTQIHQYISALSHLYPLPSASDPAPDSEDPMIDYISNLVAQAASSSSGSSVWTILNSDSQKPKLIDWAARVVNTECFPRRSEEDEEVVMYLMYLCADDKECWMMS